MKNVIYALMLLGSISWFLYQGSAGDPFGYLANLHSDLVSNPIAILIDCAGLVALLLLLQTIVSGKGSQVTTGKAGQQREAEAKAELTADFAELRAEKRWLEDELLRVSDREASAAGRVRELEIALSNAEKSLRSVKHASARPAQVEAELCSFLGILQQKGRFVDFLMQDVAGYSNEQVGAAARVVHQGCAEAVKEYFQISPVHDGREGDQVALDGSYDPLEYRLLGQAPKNPPYNGKLLHRGWKTEKITLPRVVESDSEAKIAAVIAPAEVEVQAA